MRIPKGYILQPRIFDDSESSHLPPCTREVWFYLLRNVNHAPKGQYKRAQGFFKFSDIQEALHWWVGNSRRTYSKPQITKALRRLREETMLATAKATRGVLVTVLNYDLYQDPKSYEGNGEGRAKGEGESPDGHTKNKNDKKKKRTLPPEALRLSGLLAEFVLRNNPDNLELSNGKSAKTILRWADAVDKMHRLDGRAWEKIEACIRWSLNDGFWYKNIASGQTLRDKYDTLSLAAQDKKQKQKRDSDKFGYCG